MRELYARSLKRRCGLIAITFTDVKFQGTESGEEATGLTPDWSREASGDEDDDASLMEFLPEGVTRMPSIHSKRSVADLLERTYFTG